MEKIYAYLAGIIDADGTIGIRRYKNGTGQMHYRPQIEVTNLSVDLMRLLSATFGNSACYEKNRKYKRGGIFTWRVTGTNCKKVLTACGPYLLIKKKQGAVCMRMVERIGEKGERWSVSKRRTETRERHKLYISAKKLNKH